MKRSACLSLFAGCLAAAVSASAIDLKQSKFTQIVNDVQIVSGADKSTKAASVNDLFHMPDILRTGPNSRAELVAEDQTITRVGANTIFSFKPATRTIDLQQGSLLFHSPKGKGGGTVQTGSATASVLGTTIVVVTTPNGGFKILVLEGIAEVKFQNGLKQHLSSGQMTFILPGGAMSPIIVFRLDSNTKSSQLVNGFERPLPSSGRISEAVGKQTKLITKGKAVDTGLNVGDGATTDTVQAVDPNVTQNYVNKPKPASVPSAPYEPVLVGNSYKTVDGWLVTPHDSEDPISDALAPARSLSRNIRINSSTLDSSYTFIGSTGPFDLSNPADPDCTEFLPNPFSGVFGRNLNINTPTIDLSTFGTLTTFDFLAIKDINIAQSLAIDYFVPFLRFTAIGTIKIDPGAALSGAAFSMELASCKSLAFTRADIENTVGKLSLSAHDNITLTDGSLVTTPLAPVILAGFPRDINLTAGNNVNISGTTISGDPLTVTAGKNITMNGGAVIHSPIVTLTAGDGILLDNVSLRGSTLHMTALNDVKVGSATHSQDLSGLTDVNISGHTLVFENVNFGGSAYLQSENGLLADNPNTKAAILRGYVNFYDKVKYNGTLVTSGNQSGIVNPESGPGIFISPRVH